MHSFVARGTEVAIGNVSCVQDSGAFYNVSSWAVECVKGKSYLIFLDQMVQLQGLLLQDSNFHHGSNQVYARLFRFTFEQLKIQVNSNMLTFNIKTLVKLLRKRRQLIEIPRSYQEFPPVGVLPSHLTRTRLHEDAGCWDWEVASVSRMLTDEGAFRPLHLASKVDADAVVFTFR